MSKKATYKAENIGILKGLEAIRKRPSMYVDDIGLAGFKTICREPTDNSFDEALNGHGEVIEFHVSYADGMPTFTIIDNGRGIPIDLNKETGRSVLIDLVETPHAGGKFDQSNYKMSGGLNGIGLKATNALSRYFYITSYRDGKSYTLTYERGVPTSNGLIIEDLPKENAGYTGTQVMFVPDATIFTELESFEVGKEVFEDMLRTRSFLSSRLHTDDKGEFREITCILNFNGEETVIREPEGIIGMLHTLVAGRKTYHAIPFFADKTVQETARVAGAEEDSTYDVRYQLALQFTIEEGRQRSFCNTIEQGNGGTHTRGVLDMVNKVLTDAVMAAPYVKDKDKALKITTEDTCDFMNFAVSVFHPEPIYKGQAKYVLQNRSVRTIIIKNSENDFLTWLNSLDPQIYKRIIERVVANAKSREDAKKTKDNQVKLDMGLFAMNGAGKLADARSKNRAECELFMCEGDSASGTLKEARCKNTQAVLPFRGKPLNTWEIDLNTMRGNAEIIDLTKTIGIPPFVEGREYTEEEINEAIEKCRYGKFVIIADADIDGAHIRTLLMTFFYRAYRPLVERGMLYIGLPPLYKVSKGKEVHFLKNEYELQQFSNQQLKKVDFEYFDVDGRPDTVLKQFVSKNISMTEVFNFQASKHGVEASDLGWLLTVFGFYEVNSVEDLANGLYAVLTNQCDYSVISFDTESESSFVLTYYDENNRIKVIYINDTMFNAVIELYNSLITFKHVPENIMMKLMSTIKMSLKGQELFVNSFTLLKNLLDSNPFDIIRQKGLGETNTEDLKETSVDPKTRNIRRIEISDFEQAWETTNDFMVKSTFGIAKRLQFVESLSQENSFSTDV